MPDQRTPEDGESTFVAKTRKSLLKKTVIIGAGVLVAIGLLIKFTKEQGVTEDLETDEPLDVRTPTPSELEFDSIEVFSAT